ncbi:STM4015 family protein [Paenibacillus sp. CMAA1739]|uniref:STM4015 family protein n=1 Tax=Paenibacillus ottowii TaxID=2315729 RepID=UPI0027316E78|nr:MULTISPECIES: STM4015 family protein [Paenibacillus]MDP1508606.1 STM4015 family protein [Paenibacillus ottowii]MEC4565272.1 STM4015 family protein [Paenibacillus sp. CMAA1739]
MEVKLVVDYDAYENGQTMAKSIEELAAKPESAQITDLIIGDWGGAYENSPDDFIPVLVKLKDQFPTVRKLFIGDMEYDECEVSWINQTNLSPLLEAFPKLDSLYIKGSQDLSLEPLRHNHLQELVIICGGLPVSVLQQIRNAELPELRKLELYLGVEDYGFDGKLEDILPFLNSNPFPKLTYLGLKDSEIQDEIAIAAANAPVIGQLEVLDLSQGTLSDQGAEALLASESIKGLKHLDLSYHYMSSEMMERWKKSGLSVNVEDQQEADEEDDWRYPSLTE